MNSECGVIGIAIVTVFIFIVAFYIAQRVPRHEPFIGRKKPAPRRPAPAPASKTQPADVIVEAPVNRASLDRCTGDKNGGNRPDGCACDKNEHCETAKGAACHVQKTDALDDKNKNMAGLVSMDASSRCAICQTGSPLNDFCPCSKNDDCKSKKCMTADGKTHVCMPKCQVGTQTDAEDCGQCSDNSCASGYFCQNKKCQQCSAQPPYGIGCVGCNSNRDCAAGFCDPGTKQCQRRCTLHSQCEATNLCNMNTGECRKCTRAADCPSRRCNTRTGRCM